jgi:DNA-binding MarR family transcriptional regulator
MVIIAAKESSRLCHHIDRRYFFLGANQVPAPMASVTRDDYQSMATFRHLVRKFLRFSKELVKTTAALNSEQYEALLAINAFALSDGPTIAELSERLQVKHHSAVNIVDRLVDRKLIRRKRSAQDGRVKHLELTAAGSNLLEGLAAAHSKELRRRSPEIIAALERLKQ